ncbi:hypothetical protein OX283_009855 [Flavobacterium sp. SUN052]|uniref:hypothetical protein n=1 Tax=Flavobacterium sp. SUN052 TaxID=3002441 RepID=UPI00237D3584|nr:hypothetical protein [Flavobacterium sp. SUN052]MEC4004960.1 hypothetical protein [Flavobacterium sp. SUN052]
MKRQLYLYLFILSTLVLAFTYMYLSKQVAFEKKKSQTETKSFNDSITLMKEKLQDADYFSLEQNQMAQEYFFETGYMKLLPLIKESLLAFNDDPKGNIYTGQEKMGEQKFIINKIKILNHRWIIADYSNGQMWGHVLIKYFVEENNKVSFQVMDTFLFPKENY